MKPHAYYILAIVFLLACNLSLVQVIQIQQERHVALEEYIQENHLPTPAFRIQTHRFLFNLGGSNNE